MELPRLRADLSSGPSTDPARPGLVLYDAFGFSGTQLVIPPPLVPALALFDGGHGETDLRIELRRATGEPETTLARELIDALDAAGFLENATFARMREMKIAAFAANPVRPAAHAGGGYPADPAALRARLEGYFAAHPRAPEADLCAIAAPHASPEPTARGYAAAYGALGPELRERTFIVLGTSHYGAANRFGLTRKPYETPLGRTRTDDALLEKLAAEPAALMEDYCHAVEHSIEFQVVFLQYLYGPEVRVLPILCGSFFPSVLADGHPEDDAGVRGFFEALSEIAEREAERVFWVLGVDMAHVGRRYGDGFDATAEREVMREVRERDADRIASITEGDARAFWAKIKPRGDDLKWCGASPFYTFLRCLPRVRGSLRDYAQWQIDPQSVVSYAGLEFSTVAGACSP